MKQVNRQRLFNASSLALVVTALNFAVRANLLGELALQFNLNPQQMGDVSSAAFWGFTITMFIGGPVCDKLGMGRMFSIAFVSHITGIILTIYASDYWTLFLSTLLVGIGNGFVESASYAMVSSLYPDKKVKRINDWHIWFPGGIVIGGLIAYFLTNVGAGWKLQMLVMLIPTLVYGWMFIGQAFPKSERVKQGVSDRDMIKECFKPLFIIMMLCMLSTAATELGTNQWIVELLSTIGVPSILLLVFINGIMTISRANAGFILNHVSTTGLLLFSGIFSLLGLFALSYAQGYTSFIAAGVFAMGVCFFWPTMVGFVSENLPKTGPLGMSLMGGMGLLSTSLVLPVFGWVYQSQLTRLSSGHNLEQLIRAVHGSALADTWAEIKLASGAATLRFVCVLPAILTLAFAFLHLRRNRRTDKTPAVPVAISAE